MLADHYGPRQTIPWETILNRDCCNHKGSCTLLNHIKPSQPGSAPQVLYKFVQDNWQWVPCPREFQAHSIFTRALVLTGLKLATFRTQSERRIDWANLTAYTTNVVTKTPKYTSELYNHLQIYIFRHTCSRGPRLPVHRRFSQAHPPRRTSQGFLQV